MPFGWVRTIAIVGGMVGLVAPASAEPRVWTEPGGRYSIENPHADWVDFPAEALTRTIIYAFGLAPGNAERRFKMCRVQQADLPGPSPDQVALNDVMRMLTPEQMRALIGTSEVVSFDHVMIGDVAAVDIVADGHAGVTPTRFFHRVFYLPGNENPGVHALMCAVSLPLQAGDEGQARAVLDSLTFH